MRGMVRAGNRHVFEVDKDEGQTGQNAVHHALERGTCITQTKRHADELKNAKGCHDGGLGDVVWEHLYVVVPLDEVKRGEHMGASHIVREILNVPIGLPVRHCSIVELAKISTGVPKTVRLWHHMKGRGPNRITLLNNVRFLHLLKLHLSSD